MSTGADHSPIPEPQTGYSDEAERLERELAAIAQDLRPFPAFLGMTSLQAVEVEPPAELTRDMGCVVVDPEGRLCRLDLTAVLGIEGIAEADQVERLEPLDVDGWEYVLLATRAIKQLSEEQRKRSGA